MIPKILHYAWYGPDLPPDIFWTCYRSWVKHLGRDYKFMFWNESEGMRIPEFGCSRGDQWWKVWSNYTRYYALFHFGGIWLDIDAEVIKPFDETILSKEAFLAWQRIDTLQDSINTAVMGSVPGHPFMQDMIYRIASVDREVSAIGSAVTNPTQWLLERGAGPLNTEQTVADVHIFPREYFYPYSWEESFSADCITPKTYVVHRWAKSW